MKAEFLTCLEVRMLPESDPQRWQLLSELKYQSVIMGQIITVPIGFITDFVSFVPLKGMGQRPGTIHDFLYSCVDVKREIADEVLREALKATGVDDKLAEVMFLGVREFGAAHKENIFRLDGTLIKGD